MLSQSAPRKSPGYQSGHQNVWDRFFAMSYDPQSYEGLRREADSLTIPFFQSVWGGVVSPDGDATPDENPVLDAWVQSAEGEETLAALVTDIQNHIATVAGAALPAHDIRQILFKDSSEALRFYHMERPQGFKSAFVIPTFCHDIGRLLEGNFFHPENLHAKWIPHAKLSFLLLKEILDKPDYAAMPRDLKNHFLYAVLAHSGENGKTFMSRAVQACDRMQLVGPEGFFRANAYGLCLLRADIKCPEHDSYRVDLPVFGHHHSVLSELEFFARNMRDNIGTSHKEWQDRIATENVALLLKASARQDDVRNRIFFPEQNKDVSIDFGPGKRPIASDIFYKANYLTDSFAHIRTHGVSSSDVADKLCSALEDLPGAAKLSPDMRVSVAFAIGNIKTQAYIKRSSVI